ncbi:unnamed protein product [Echinostoma caproni]|uniref:Uncharacterized protein n=1 Tax=Echinostoma caproni TaxID=27848 RepID=A0A3P8GX41_9TREM|nr:unnamed protein product [Echinostoma caproni]
MKSVIDGMSLLSPHDGNRDFPGVSDTQLIPFVEDFVLALAMCNTAVVSATKNSASMVSFAQCVCLCTYVLVFHQSTDVFIQFNGQYFS